MSCFMNQIAYHADGALSQFYTVTQFKWTALRNSNVQKHHQVLSLSIHTHMHTHTWPVSCDRGRDNFVTCWAVSPSKRWSQPSALPLFGCPGCGSLRTRPVGKIQVKHAQLSKTHTHEHCSGFQHNWAFCRTFNSSSMIDFNDIS